MKKIFFSVLLILSISVYPLTLTPQDFQKVRNIQRSFIALGTLGAAIGTIKYISGLPFIFSDAEEAANLALPQAAFIRFFLLPALIQYGLKTLIAGMTPLITVNYLGDIVAALYISRKYHVDIKTAWDAIKKNSAIPN